MIIKTKRNMVSALEPLDRDCMVETLIQGGDGKRIRLTLQPISCYQAAVDWAVSVADQFAHPIQIVPMDLSDVASVHRDRFIRGLQLLTHEQRFNLRSVAIATCAEVMRDCDDQAIRSDAYDLLVKLGVIR